MVLFQMLALCKAYMNTYSNVLDYKTEVPIRSYYIYYNTIVVCY